MGLYLFRGRYSQEAIRGLIAKPEDRTPAIRALYETGGVKLLHLWLGDRFEIFSIVEGEPIKNTAVGGMLLASGMITDPSSTELMTFGQLAEAMKGGGALAAKYRQPGK
jgi:uncharacterized protein with GYD domain